jgi:hypothetical protein
MSRPTVVRRLTAVLALLAVLCLALPAAAAPGARGQSPRAHVAQESSLVDQLLAWIGGFWSGASQGQAERMDKAGAPLQVTPGTSSVVQPDNKTEHSGMIDPNG